MATWGGRCVFVFTDSGDGRRTHRRAPDKIASGLDSFVARFLLLLAAACMMFAYAPPAQAQHLSRILPNTEPLPTSVAVNPVTNQIYIPSVDGNLTVIDGATNNSYTVSDPNGASGSYSVAVNVVTNMVFVANQGTNSVSIYTGAVGATHAAWSSTIDLPNGSAPLAIAVNAQTNIVYTANSGNNTVSSLNPVNDSIINNITVGTGPGSLAVNSVSNLVYVGDTGYQNQTQLNDGDITILNGALPTMPEPSPSSVASTISNATTSTSNIIDVTAVAVNEHTGLAYAASFTPGFVIVMNGTAYSTTLTPPGLGAPVSIAVNPQTNMAYVTGFGDNTVFIQGSTVVGAPLNTGAGSIGVVVDTITNTVFVSANNLNSPNGGQITVIDGNTNTQIGNTLTAGVEAQSLGVNPVTHRVYVAGYTTPGTVTVIDGARDAFTSVSTLQSGFVSMAVDPVANLIYIVNDGSETLTIVDGNSDTNIANIPIGAQSTGVAVNPITHMAYVAVGDGGNNYTYFSGHTFEGNIDETSLSGPVGVVANPVNNQIYGYDSGTPSGYTIIDGATSTRIGSIPGIGGDTSFSGMALDQVTDQIYVALGSNFSGSLLVMDGGGQFGYGQYSVALPANTGFPEGIAVNPNTNFVYVATSASNDQSTAGVLHVVSGGTFTAPYQAQYSHTVSVPNLNGGVSPTGIAVNPVSNMVYVANIAPGQISVFSGATNAPFVAAAYVAAIDVTDSSHNATSVAVNPVTNKIYATTSAGTIVVIDGVSNTVIDEISENFGSQPVFSGVSTITNQAFFANNADGTVGVIAEDQTQTSPALTLDITTAISTLPGDTTASPTPTFDFTTTNNLTSVGVNAAYYQIDTWQGPWTLAHATSGGVFSATTPVLQPGFHTIYAYATDGQEADASSFGAGPQGQPIIGQIASYGFVVAPPIAYLAPAGGAASGQLAFGPTNLNQPSAPLAATMANEGGTSLTYTFAIVKDPANNTDFSDDFNFTSQSCVGGPLVPTSATNPPCQFNIIFTPSTIGAESALLVVTSNSYGIADSQQTILLSGIGVSTSVTLSISGLGTGTGHITDATSAISCFVNAGVPSGTCSAQFASGAMVSLTAQWTGYSTFDGWGNGCANFATNNPCTLTLTTNTAVTAQFDLPSTFPFTITVIGTGSGEIGHDDLDCVDTAGVASHNCMETVAPGNSVSLFAEPQEDGSMFGGWGGSAAFCGMNQSCLVPVNGPTTVTASFVAAPVNVTLTFTTSASPQTKIATFNCPSNADPCLDPNAHSLALTVPAVNTTFTMTVIANEVSPFQANGDCASGNDVTDDFDCRFVSFFAFGPDSGSGEVVPLCVPYSNGNCIFYSAVVCLPTGPSCVASPGTEPDPSFYQSPVNWLIKWNNAAFTPPATYQPIPRLYDDPDSQVNNTDPYGTSCSTAMKINGVPTSSPAIFCQFVYDITSVPFFVTTGVDPGIGGTTRQFNDVVVAFPVTLNPQFLDSSDSATSDPLGNIGFTDAVSNPSANTISVTNVTLSDPLPPGPGSPVTWVISPAYSGPGTCAITGAIGSQVLSCSFGDFAPGAGASVHVSAANPGLGQYLNAATVTANTGGQKNQTLLSIATVTVQLASSTFSSLISPPSTTFGSPVSLSGVISADDPVYPPTTESVSITIAGIAQKAPIGPNGVFQAKFTNVPASSAPYVITYQYAGDANFAPATNTSTTLTVGKANSSTTITSNSPNPSTTAQSVTVGFKVTGVAGATTPTGSVTVTAKLSATTVTCSGTLTSGTGSCSLSLTTAGAWTLTASYGGDTNYTTSVSGGTTQTVNPPGSTLKFSPSPLNFGTVYVGTTEIDTMTVTNTGTSMVTFSSFSIASISGDDSSGFLGITFCPRTLNAGKSCTIFMSFTADSNVTKTHAANLVVVDNGAGSPQMVLMSATVINPVASLSPSSLNFGTVKTNTTSAAKTITLTNSGTTALTISSVSISGNFALATGTTCAHGTTLTPSTHCSIMVTFKPTSKGSKSGTVTVTDNALHGTSTVGLSGTGN